MDYLHKTYKWITSGFTAEMDTIQSEIFSVNENDESYRFHMN